MKKDIVIGFIVALLATACGVFIYMQFISKFGFQETLAMMEHTEVFGKIVTLGAIPNLFVFSIFIKKKQDQRAKGVLIATILLAISLLVLKFF